VGNLAWLLGLITIFLAGELAKANFIPTREYYGRIFAFAVVHILFHAFLTAQRFWAQSQYKVRAIKTNN